MNGATSAIQKPFIEHVYELRKRALISVLTISVWGLVGYALNGKLLHIIQKPLGETLFYTTPTGGFSFIFKLCILFGLILALPVIIYQALKFFSPLMERITRRFIGLCLVSSVLLALMGIAFAYFISLPAALHFLTSFGGNDIKALINADAYFNFALAYIGGFAVLFQLPLLLLLINRIKPLKPGPLMRYQRYVILASFIVAAILTPTPDPVNQTIMAIPVILLYQISIVLIWLINLNRKKVVNSPIPIQIVPITSSRDHQIGELLHIPSIQSKLVVKKTDKQKRFIDIIPANKVRVGNANSLQPSVKIAQSRNTNLPSTQFLDMVKT